MNYNNNAALKSFLECKTETEVEEFLKTLDVDAMAKLLIDVSELSSTHITPKGADSQPPAFSVVYTMNNSAEFYKAVAYIGMKKYIETCISELTRTTEDEDLKKGLELISEKVFKRDDKPEVGVKLFRHFCDSQYESIVDDVFNQTGLVEVIPCASSIMIAKTTDTEEEAATYIQNEIGRSMPSTLTSFVVKHNKWSLLSPYKKNADTKLIDKEAAVIGTIMNERIKDEAITESLLAARKINNVVGEDARVIADKMDSANVLYKQSDNPIELDNNEHELRVVDVSSEGKTTYYAI